MDTQAGAASMVRQNVEGLDAGRHAAVPSCWSNAELKRSGVELLPSTETGPARPGLAHGGGARSEHARACWK